MKVTKTAIFIAGPKIDSDDYLIAAFAFPKVNFPVKNITNIKFCNISINDIPNVYCAVYSGNQTTADEMLVQELNYWSYKYILRNVPYLAIKIKWNEQLFKTITSIEVAADIKF